MRAKKSLGQNFLHDNQIVEKIIESVSPTKDEVILEVGPGEGVLTEKLAEKKSRVIAIELDDRLIPELEKKFEKQESVNIVHGDILEVNLCEIIPDQSIPYRVVGNLPYYITSKIIRMFLELENSPSEMFFMVQREVAERICAQKGEMSILSVSIQRYAKPEILFSVPARAFSPIPKVDSAFIKITIKEKIEKTEKEKLFFRLVKMGFSARRKTLANNLSAGLQISRSEVEKILKEADIRINIRAQELNIAMWQKLSSAIVQGLPEE
jgi:16S rRNA (adenine1518-N6/adenine1519-N6)-dimethyltransferase